MANRYAQVREWGLVLDAEDLPYDIQQDESGGWHLVVDPEHSERAGAVLRAWHRENRPPRIGGPAPDYGRTPAGLAAVALLIGIFALSGPREGGAIYFSRGAAVASRILDGEWWRAITALSLHADFGHILSNALFGALFFTLVARALGSGVGMGLILLSGTGGNLLNAFLRQDFHSTVGASTAVFGAIGILGGLQLARRRAGGASGGKAWLPVLAATGLLVLTGMDPESDILAHILGFLVGIPLGAAAGWGLPKLPSRPVQWLLLALTAGLLGGAWWLALGG
jgi:membrane associated rhomboid family serine protease